jgi:hypothetical protein
MRFQRSIRILPGVRLNLSKSGLGVSAGVRGLRVGVDSKGRKYANVGLPGTGISSRHYFQSSQASEPLAVPPLLPAAIPDDPNRPTSLPGLLMVAFVTAAILIAAGAIVVHLFG